MTTKDGLASDNTKFIFQDSKGFYWIGYDNGFQKYDGKNFSTTRFNNKYVYSQMLDQTPLLMTEDKSGNVYILNNGSLYVYHATGQIDTVQILEKFDKRISGIRYACRDEWDNIWVSTNNNLYKLDKINRKCIFWLTTGKQRFNDSFISIIYDKSKKCLWLGKDNNIFLIDISSKIITQPFLSSTPGVQNLSTKFTFAAFWMDSKHNLWTSQWNGNLYKYNTVTYKKELIDLVNSGASKKSQDETIAICFAEDNQKSIWIGSINGGLNVYHENTNIIVPVSANNNSPQTLLQGGSIYPLYKDKEGNIWAGTEKGIFIFNPCLQQFNNIDEASMGSFFKNPNLTSVFQTGTGDILV